MHMYSRFTICFLIIFNSNCLKAQENNPYKDYQNFVRQELKRIDDYRRKENANFLGFLKEYWEFIPSQNAIPRPLRPEPIKPEERKKEDTVPIPEEIIIDKVITHPQPIPPTPSKREPDSREQPRGQFMFSFYGTSCRAGDISNLQVPINSSNASIESLQTAWNILNQKNLQPTIDDCLKLKQILRLNDWGYVLLTKQLARQLQGNTNTNAATFLHFYLLSQSGYQAKVGRCNGKIVLLLASESIIYATPFMTIGGIQYHIYGENLGSNPGKIETFREELSYANHAIDYRLTTSVQLTNKSYSRHLKSPLNKIEVTAVVNQNIIDFYKDYPQCEVGIYACSPIDPHTDQSVLPALKKQIQGKNETEAANLLLQFVQTAFEYATDFQQFGYEKPFFVEESFFYPYCDCEDRAVLYAWLVSKLLKLEVVLLDYPGHVATAVKFNQKVKGDFIHYKGENFIICDPTYINANIGEAMESSKRQSPQIIPLI